MDIKKNATIKFLTLYLLSISIIVVLFAALWKNTPPKTEKILVAGNERSNPEIKELLHANTLLHTNLHKLDEQYAIFFEDIDDILSEIRVDSLEQQFKKTIDSIQNKSLQSKDTQFRNEIRTITAHFNKTLENRRYMKGSFSSFPQTDNIQTEDRSLVQLQNNIAEKDRKITALEQNLSEVKKEADKTIASLRNQLNVQTKRNSPKESNSYKAAKGESAEDLKQRNTNLRLAYNNLLTQHGVLTKAYNIVVAEKKSLTAQLIQSKKTSSLNN